MVRGPKMYSLFWKRWPAAGRLRLRPWRRWATGVRHLASAEEERRPKPQNKVVEALPGVVAAVGVSQAGFFVADRLGQALLDWQGITGSSPVSGIPVAVLIGLGLNNTLSLPASLKPGLKACTTLALRAGIVCVGAKLSLMDVVHTGALGIPCVVACITTGMTFIPWLARRFGLPERMGSLIAVGSSICGVTAITATKPVIGADEKEFAFAVANVVAFGTFGMLVYPYLAHMIFADSHQIGLFLGMAIHDTSQVVGAAMTYSQVYSDEVVLQVATVTKLTRNLFLAVVIPYMAMKSAVAGKARSKMTFADFAKHVPGFVIGFVGMSVLRSIGDWSIASNGSVLNLLDPEQWSSLTSMVGKKISAPLLGTAMAAVGLNISFSSLRGVGYKPFAVGLLGSMAVAGVGFSTAVLTSYWSTPEVVGAV